MISLKGFLLLGIMATFCLPPMNYSFDILTVTGVAGILLNASSSNFPGSSFLNYVLYGSENATFSYNDFIKSYGFKVTSFDIGNLIIGKDGKLGGIYYGFDTVIIPVPKGMVQAISKSSLKKYFPKGYVIKSPVLGDFTHQAYIGNMSSLFRSTELICDNCTIEFWDYAEVPDFYPLSVFWLHQRIIDEDSFLDMFGYIDQYDNQSDSGNWTIRFVYTNVYGLNSSYYLVDPESIEQASYTLDEYGGVQFNGGIYIYFGNATCIYRFNGSMAPSANNSFFTIPI